MLLLIKIKGWIVLHILSIAFLVGQCDTDFYICSECVTKEFVSGCFRAMMQAFLVPSLQYCIILRLQYVCRLPAW